ncbi:MAG: tetratricopeptide repeat protein [Rhodocyclaceae bacterium]|nr:tetratricopeptide repeat protein [Rhodocyclaceae bacterium]
MHKAEDSRTRSPAKTRVDSRPRAIGLTLAGVLIGGLLIARYDDIVESVSSLRLRGHVEIQRRNAQDQRNTELDQRFSQGVVMLHARRYDDAAQAFHRVLQLAPELPEAHVNMGFAMIGLKQWGTAHDFFNTAIELHPEQANAYYGLAICLEAMSDLPGAINAMQTYLHRGAADDPYRRKAQAALWEWRETFNAMRQFPGREQPPSPDSAQPDSQVRESDAPATPR